MNSQDKNENPSGSTPEGKIPRRDFLRAGAAAAATVITGAAAKVLAREAPSSRKEPALLAEVPPDIEVHLDDQDGVMGIVSDQDKTTFYFHHKNADRITVELWACEVDFQGNLSSPIRIENCPDLRYNHSYGTFLKLSDGKHLSIINDKDTNSPHLNIAIIDPATHQAQVIGQHPLDNPSHGLATATYNEAGNVVYLVRDPESGLIEAWEIYSDGISWNHRKIVESFKGAGHAITGAAICQDYLVAASQADDSEIITISSYNYKTQDPLKNRQIFFDAAKFCCPVLVLADQKTFFAYIDKNNHPVLGRYNPIDNTPTILEQFENFQARTNIPGGRYPRGKTLNLFQNTSGSWTFRFIEDTVSDSTGKIFEAKINSQGQVIESFHEVAVQTRHNTGEWGQPACAIESASNGDLFTVSDGGYAEKTNGHCFFLRATVSSTPTPTPSPTTTHTPTPLPTKEPTATSTPQKPPTATTPPTATPKQTSTPVATATVTSKPPEQTPTATGIPQSPTPEKTATPQKPTATPTVPEIPGTPTSTATPDQTPKPSPTPTLKLKTFLGSILNRFGGSKPQ